MRTKSGAKLLDFDLAKLQEDISVMASALTEMDKSRHDGDRWPRFLPDGKHFVYRAITHNSPRDPNNGIYFGSLDGKQTRFLMQSDTQANIRPAICCFSATPLTAQPLRRFFARHSGTDR